MLLEHGFVLALVVLDVPFGMKNGSLKTEDFSGNGSGSMLSITYKYLPECKCSCPNEGIICNTPCHIAESVWIATCSNGQISGTKYPGNTASGSPLSGLVSESSIVLQYGGSTSHGSR